LDIGPFLFRTAFVTVARSLPIAIPSTIVALGPAPYLRFWMSMGWPNLYKAKNRRLIWRHSKYRRWIRISYRVFHDCKDYVLRFQEGFLLCGQNLFPHILYYRRLEIKRQEFKSGSHWMRVTLVFLPTWRVSY
jgi:hypothetical protein